MVSDTQNKQNLRTAARQAARSLGYDAATFEPRTFSYDQLRDFNGALANVILAYPALFTDGTLYLARDVSNKDYGAIVQTAATFDDYADAFAGEALKVGDSVADVGRGVQAAASTLGALLPVVVVVGLGIVLYNFQRKTA